MEQGGEDVPVHGGLVQELDEGGVAEHGRDDCVLKERLHVLGDAGGLRAPFAAAGEYLADEVDALVVAVEEDVDLVHVDPGLFALLAVGHDAVPDVVEDDEIGHGLDVGADVLDVIDHEAVVDVNV